LPSPGCQEHALFDMQYAFKESEIRMDYRMDFLITSLQQEWVQNRNLNQKREQKMSKFSLSPENILMRFSKDIIAHRFIKPTIIWCFRH